MDEWLISRLEEITPEEKEILNGRRTIEGERYFYSDRLVIDSKKMLDRGKLIDIRTHTRFIPFPKHRHNFIEMQYVCRGSITNIINGKKIKLQQGEILLLGQNVYHEIEECSKQDIIVNFIVLPEFFDTARKMMGNKNVLSNFLIESLKMNNSRAGILHFKVSEDKQIQNLIENLIISIKYSKSQKDDINRITMGLVFMHLLNNIKSVQALDSQDDTDLVLMTVMKYIEDFYFDCSLTELSKMLHYSTYNLSKLIKQHTGYTFKQLLQAKRLKKAIELICETSMPITDIVVAVGYENASYFHRKFKEKYGMSPSEFRKNNKNKDKVNI